MQLPFAQARTLIEDHSTIWCVCHTNPDGDALGSLLALRSLLKLQYPQKKVIAYCKDPAPEHFAYLPEVRALEHSMDAATDALIIYTDCAVPKQTGLLDEHPALFSTEYATINIDHHISNAQYAQCNIVDTEAASACEVVYALATESGWRMTPAIATQLLTGLLTDTGSLLHGNTNVRSYKTAAALLRLQADHATVVRDVFRTAKISTLRLWGRVLEKMHITPEGAAVSAVTRADFTSAQAEYSELNGAIDYLNSVPGMRFSLLLAEKDASTVKGSLRTLRPDIDVAEMASKFDGGGHKAAAGFSIEGTLEQATTWQVKPAGS